MKITNKHFKKMAVTVALCSALPLTSLPAQIQLTPQPTLEVFELKFERLDRYVQTLKQEIKLLHEQIQEKTAQIGELKASGKLDYLQQQSLKRLLQESQDLSNTVTEHDLSLREAKVNWGKSGNALLRLYDEEIARALQQLESTKSSKKRKETVYHKLAGLRNKRQQLKVTLEQQEVQEVKVNELKISPEDSPKKIRQKADLLKDQEEKMRRQSKALHGRSKELQSQLNLRIRMSELVSDLALFDQQEEAVTALSAARSVAETGTDFTDAAVSQDNRLASQKSFDFEVLSTEQIEELILQIKKKQHITAARADSLADRANKFYQAAEKLRNK